MKLHNEDSDVLVSNVGEKRQFTMKATSKAFKIMSSNLYSNKIQAIVRELSTNAYDAHVAANKKDEPFFIFVPTRFEPYFAVRDYGTSMTDQQVLSLYTTFFDSTKNDSNDFVGALGLGSKSPFSYANSFSVTTFLNGTKRNYSCYLDESGCPAIVSLGESETTEENGVEVRVPVETHDIRNFINEINYVHYYFNVKPKYSSNDMLDVGGYKDHSNELLTGLVYYNTRTHNTVALQGNVSYPITSKSITDIMGENQEVIDNRQDVRDFIDSRSNYIIPFEIGELDVAPSREALSYDVYTVENIVKKIRQIISTVQSRFVEKTKDVTDLYKLFDLRSQLVSILGYYATSLSVKSLENITDLGQVTLKLFNDGGDLSKFDFVHIKNNKIKNKFIDFKVNVPSTTTSRFSSFISEEVFDKKEIDLSNILMHSSYDLRKTLFIINDDSTTTERMVMGAIRAHTKYPVTTVVIIFNGTKKELQNFFGDKFTVAADKMKTVSEIKLLNKSETTKERVKKEKENVEILGMTNKHAMRITYGEFSKYDTVYVVYGNPNPLAQVAAKIAAIYKLPTHEVLHVSMDKQRFNKLCDEWEVKAIDLMEVISSKAVPTDVENYVVASHVTVVSGSATKIKSVHKLLKEYGLLVKGIDCDVEYNTRIAYDYLHTYLKLTDKFANRIKAMENAKSKLEAKYPLLTQLVNGYQFEIKDIEHYINVVDLAHKNK